MRLASTLTPRSGWSQLFWLAAFTSQATSLSSPSAWETEVLFPLQQAVETPSSFIHSTTPVFPLRRLRLTYKTDITFAINIFL